MRMRERAVSAGGVSAPMKKDALERTLLKSLAEKRSMAVPLRLCSEASADTTRGSKSAADTTPLLIRSSIWEGVAQGTAEMGPQLTLKNASRISIFLRG